VLGFLRNTRHRLLESSRGDASLPRDKKHRPNWFLRLACTAFDTGTVGVLISTFLYPLGFPSEIFGALVMVATPLYYMIWEWLIGRTPAKVILGCRMISASGEAPGARLIVRGILRNIPVLNFFSMFSWRRVTFLDLISGTRVQVKPVMKNRLLKASLNKKTSNPAHPRGFDEKMSQR